MTALGDRQLSLSATHGMRSLTVDVTLMAAGIALGGLGPKQILQDELQLEGKGEQPHKPWHKYAVGGKK